MEKKIVSFVNLYKNLQIQVICANTFVHHCIIYFVNIYYMLSVEFLMAKYCHRYYILVIMINNH